MSTYYVNTYREDNGKLMLGGSVELDSPPETDKLDRRIRAVWKIDGVDSIDEAIGALLTSLADQYLGSDITVTRLVPREPTSDERLEAARRALRADYWDDVRSVADDIKDEIEKGELTDSDAVTEYLEESIDSQRRVIYTYAAMETVMFSDNDGAYEMHFGSEGLVEDGQVQWSRLAFYAMLEDVRNLLGDVDELLAEHATECADCGVAFTDDDEAEVYEGERIHISCPEDEEEED